MLFEMRTATTAAILLWLTIAAADGGARGEEVLATPACSKFCNASCCGFTEPAKECSGCRQSLTFACHMDSCVAST